MTTSKRSKEPILEQLTLSPAGSHASHLVLPGSSEAVMMTVISGRKCSASFLKHDPASSWVKTLLESSRWNSTLYGLTWKHSATASGRSLFRLVPSTRSIVVKDSGSWPTATATVRPMEGNVRILRKKVLAGEMTHEEAEAMLGKSPMEAQGVIPAAKPWPTPTSRDWKDTGNFTPRPEKHKLPHSVAVAPFPTPSASDNRDRGHANMPAIQRRIEKGKQVMLSMTVQQQKGEKMHGRWVLALMGYPHDWCDLDGPMEAGK